LGAAGAFFTGMRSVTAPVAFEIGAVPKGGRRTMRPAPTAGGAASMALKSTVTWAWAAKLNALKAVPKSAARSKIVVALVIVMRRSTCV
jgi:hypothetical protein